MSGVILYAQYDEEPERICTSKRCTNVIKSGTNNKCRKCNHKLLKKRDIVKYTFFAWKSNCKRRGKENNVTLEEFREWCIKTDYIAKKGRGKNKCAIDRIDCTKGYTIDNMQIITNSQNGKKRHDEYKGVGTAQVNFSADPDDENFVPF